jgi:4-hydroxy-3-methylbut-2-enyl diphosphate reductase
VTSGASAPEYLVEELIAHVKSLGAVEVVDLLTVEEDVHFPLPAELLEARSRRGAIALPTI